MKVYALLWSLTWAIAGVSAYDLYGGYERILYYNAYRMDWGKTGGDLNRMAIANGCGKSGKPCDLLQFVEFINHDGKKPVLNMKNAPKGWDPLDMKPEHVDWAAKALRDAGATGTYDPNKIYKGIGRQDVDGLFRKVGEYIRGAQGAAGVPANSIECAKKAVNVWADLRKWAQTLSFQQFLEKEYKTALETKYPKDPGLVSETHQVGETGETVKTMNVEESIKKLRTLPGMERYKAKSDLVPWRKADPGHDEKVSLANNAKIAITGECGKSE